MLVSDDRLTVIDFFCHRVDSIWIDPLNVVTYLQTQRPSVTLSRRRVERLRDAFCTVTDDVWKRSGRNVVCAWPISKSAVCRMRCVRPAVVWADRYRRRKVIRELIRDLAGGKDTLALTP